jgi:hypothetical protein
LNSGNVFTFMLCWKFEICEHSSWGNGENYEILIFGNIGLEHGVAQW